MITTAPPLRKPGTITTANSYRPRHATLAFMSEENTLQQSVAQKHILVVDDERNLLNTIEFILEAANYRVSIAQDGQSALEQILEHAPKSSHIDLLITDIRMPRMSGIELIARLKRLGIIIPVIVMTNHGNTKMKITLRQHGCEYFLDKPVSEDELLQNVTALLGS